MKIKKGFTLVEMLVIISIMSILAGILVVNGISYKEKVKDLKAINTAKQVKEIVLSSYSQQGGNIIISDILDIINSYTDLTSLNASHIVKIDNKNIEIKFLSDKSNYIMDLNMDTNLCVLKKGSKVLINDTE